MAIATEPSYVESFDTARFPFHRERVVATGDGEVLRGHLNVAWAIVEAWCADNPILFVAVIERWIEQAKAADDKDQAARRREEDRLGYNQRLAAELERNPARVFARAGLTAHEIRAMELRQDGKSFAEIGFAFGVSKQAIAETVNRAIEKILSLDGPEVSLIRGPFPSQTQPPC